MRGEIRPTQPQPIASEPPLGRRRRKRQEGATAKQPALPALSAQDYAQIRELAAQMAGETAQHFVEALPAAVRGQLSPEALEACQRGLAGELESSLSGQLAWALNQAWQEARDSESTGGGE